MRRLAIQAIACLLLIVSAQSANSAKEPWTSIRSKNFFLVGNASEREIRQVAVRLEEFREVASRLFIKANFNSPIPTTVVVFKSDSSYRPFKPNANTAGYFQSGPDVNYITLKTEVSDDLNPFGVIFHEYTHLLINNTSGNVPTWFNEGLAEYYSTFGTEGQKIVLGRPIAHHVFRLRENKMLPLRTLFKVDQDSAYYNESDKQSIFYAESWALTHYLILGNKGERLEQLVKFLQLIDTNVPMEQAFQQAFQTTFEKLENGLREYIKRNSYPVTTEPFERKPGFYTEMQAAAVTDAEIQSYLGDLLLHSDRPEAEAYLQKALALDSKLALANASMGMLRVRQGRIDEARQSLERAVAANSQNYLIHYYYAFALSREGMNESQLVTEYSPETAARIREELKKAIELRPDYPESYNLLAFVNLVTETQLDESITYLRRGLALSPGRKDLLFTLAQVYLRQQDFKAARQILEQLIQNNGDQRLRQRAQGLLAHLTTREAEVSQNLREKGIEPRLVAGAATKSEAVEAPGDPSSDLRGALRKPKAGERQIHGSLVRIDCDAKGITFVIRVDDRLIKLRTDRFQDVPKVAFSADAGREITCGARNPENAVVICYVPNVAPQAGFAGTIKSIEFVPKDFKLKA